MTAKRRHRWGRGLTDIYSREIDECSACDTQRDIDPGSGKRVYLWRSVGKWRFKCPPCIRETGLKILNCPECRGKGEKRFLGNAPMGRSGTERCAACEGTGRVSETDEKGATEKDFENLERVAKVLNAQDCERADDGIRAPEEGACGIPSGWKAP